MGSIVLASCDLAARTNICADKILLWIGHSAHSQQWRPAAYASRTMTETEERYSQIEREALIMVWKFSDYIIGKQFI